MKLVHISKHKRSEGALGGVEKFAYYLSLVFPKLRMLSLADYEGGFPELQWDQAEQMNKQFLSKGLVDRKTIVITDGYWGRGLAGRVKSLITVAHGTYIGVALSNEIFPLTSHENLLIQSRIQGQVYSQADAVVAVSRRVQEEIWDAYGLETIKIINGIDLDIFKPNLRRRQPDLILHVSTDRGRKQLELVEGIQATAKDLRIESLNARTGKLEDEAARWQEGAVLFQPSLYEGCSYASIEAMACGCVPVAYRIGLWSEVPDSVGIFIDDHHVVPYIKGLQSALRDHQSYKPREWVEKNASFSIFRDKWERLIASCD